MVFCGQQEASRVAMVCHRNTMLAYVFGRHQDGVVFKALKKLLASFQIAHYDTDNRATYERCLETQQHTHREIPHSEN